MDIVTAIPITKPSCLHDGLRIAEGITTSLGLTLNAALAFLILYRTENELRLYRRVLICNCCVDTVFSVLAFVFEIHLDIRKGMYVIVNNGFFGGSFERNFNIQCFQIFMIYFTTAIVCLPMLYRYLALCRDQVLTAPQFALLFLTILLISSSVPITEAIFWHPVSERELIEQANVIASMPCSDPGEIYLIVLSDAFSPAVITPLLASGFVISATYGTIMFCALKIKKIVAAQRSVSQRTRSLQKQIHYTLLVQVTTPLILFVLPISGGLAALLTGLGLFRFFLVTAFSMFSFMPVINALSTILLIKCYRRALLGALGNIPGMGKIRPLTSKSSSGRQAAAAGRAEPITAITSTVLIVERPASDVL